MQLVISADFSDPTGVILAGISEKSLAATDLRVADADNSPLTAVKLLGTKYRRALVIDHRFDNDAGWIAHRRNFRRSPTKDAAP